MPAGTITGRIERLRSAELGLAADVAIVAGTTDGCAAFLAAGAETCGHAVTSLGTTLVLKVLSNRAIFAPKFGVYSHRIGNAWLVGALRIAAARRSPSILSRPPSRAVEEDGPKSAK